LACEFGFLLRKAAARFIDKELDDRETSSITGATYVRNPRFFDIFGVDEDEDDVYRDDDDDELEKRADHAASTVADLLVEAGSFQHRGAALHHLLRTNSGFRRVPRKKTCRACMRGVRMFLYMDVLVAHRPRMEKVADKGLFAAR